MKFIYLLQMAMACRHSLERALKTFTELCQVRLAEDPPMFTLTFSNLWMLPVTFPGLSSFPCPLLFIPRYATITPIAATMGEIIVAIRVPLLKPLADG